MFNRLIRWLALTLTLGITAYCFGLGIGYLTIKPPREAGESSPPVSATPGRPRMSPLLTALGGSPANPRHTTVVDISQRVSPAVVSIGVTRLTGSREWDMFGGDQFFPPYSIILRERTFPYLGSGFIIDQQGHVLTNYHVIEDASSITITLTDRRTFSARLLDADRYVDVALLKMEGVRDEVLPAIALGNSDEIMIGETVLAIGNPYGPLIADPRPSVSLGVVSAVKRSFRGPQQEHIYQDMIQTDAAINPGNSGGPLINLEGEAIGINTFIVSRSGGSENIGFSIPINRARRVVDEILRFGRVRDIQLDFDFLNISPYIVQLLGLKTERGVLVTRLETGGPAEMAGLEPGDVIVAIEYREIRDTRDLLDQFLTRTVGESIIISVQRGDLTLDLDYNIREGTTDR